MVAIAKVSGTLWLCMFEFTNLPKYEVKVKLVFIKFQGMIAKAKIKQMIAPLR